MEVFKLPFLEKRESGDKDMDLLKSNIGAIDTLLKLDNKEDIRQFSVLTFCDMFLVNPTVIKFLELDKKEDLANRIKNLRGKVGANREEQDYVELGAIIGEVKGIFQQIV
jgi:hypothetical protein